MATPHPIQRAKRLRDAAPLKERRPERLFSNRLEEPWRILQLVEINMTNEATKLEARGMFVVSLATAFELYWREFFRAMINRYTKDGQSMGHLTKVSVSIGDVATFIGEKLTLGELISCAYSFRGPEALNLAASTILQVDAFGSFRKSKYMIKEVPRKNRASKHGPIAEDTVLGKEILADTLPLLARCFTIRNETVHNFGKMYVVSRGDIFKMKAQIGTFNIFFGLFVERLLERRGNKRSV